MGVCRAKQVKAISPQEPGKIRDLLVTAGIRQRQIQNGRRHMSEMHATTNATPTCRCNTLN
jgi:hypothetical protein